MTITFQTNVDQDLGIEQMRDAVKSPLPVDKFAAQLVQDFLNNLTPRLKAQPAEALKRALDTATDEQIAAAAAAVKS